jgi:hypothetical protein
MSVQEPSLFTNQFLLQTGSGKNWSSLWYDTDRTETVSNNYSLARKVFIELLPSHDIGLLRQTRARNNSSKPQKAQYLTVAQERSSTCKSHSHKLQQA